MPEPDQRQERSRQGHSLRPQSWEVFCRFTEDGRFEMSNNAAERAIRPLTLGRRNGTFLGSDSGGERAAMSPR